LARNYLRGNLFYYRDDEEWYPYYLTEEKALISGSKSTEKHNTFDIYDFYNVSGGVADFNFQKFLQYFGEFGNHTQLDVYNLTTYKDQVADSISNYKFVRNYYHVPSKYSKNLLIYLCWSLNLEVFQYLKAYLKVKKFPRTNS